MKIRKKKMSKRGNKLKAAAPKAAQNQQPNPSNQRRYKPSGKALKWRKINNQTLRTKEGTSLSTKQKPS